MSHPAEPPAPSVAQDVNTLAAALQKPVDAYPLCIIESIANAVQVFMAYSSECNERDFYRVRSNTVHYINAVKAFLPDDAPDYLTRFIEEKLALLGVVGFCPRKRWVFRLFGAKTR